MRFIGRIFGIIVVIALYLLLWAMCKVSSLDERRRERMSRSWDDDDFFEHNKPKFLDKDD